MRTTDSERATEVPMAASPSGRLAGTTALVTGASQGLGRAVALAFAREGADLVLVARRATPLEAVRGEVEALGVRALAIPADVGDADDVERVAAAALATFERVDVLVNNASELGPTPMPYLLDTDPDAMQRVLAVNVVGPFLLTRALLGPMLAAGRGCVVNVSSDAGVVGYPGWGAYGLSKAGLDQLTRIWSSELDGTGVRVNSVDPGDMATAMHAAALPDDDPAQLAKPEERTDVFVWLAGPAAAGVTGERLEAAEFVPAEAEAAAGR
jgi:NAD(P)-dependent dehydrogenase (short-subunit alcohol dehydrogenase family)